MATKRMSKNKVHPLDAPHAPTHIPRSDRQEQKQHPNFNLKQATNQQQQ